MPPARLLALVMALPLACAAADVGSPCTVLAGGGRQVSEDAQVNEGWNRLNFAFFDAALTALSAQDTVVPAFITLGSGDAARSADKALSQAHRQGCRRLMRVSVFDDVSKPEGEIVFSVRVAPLAATGRPRRAASASADAGAAVPPALTAATPSYQREYRYAATPDSLSRVVPSRIAEQAVRDYLDSLGR